MTEPISGPVKPYSPVEFLVYLLIFTSNKKAATEILFSDSGPTISFFNLQKYISIPGP